MSETLSIDPSGTQDRLPEPNNERDPVLDQEFQRVLGEAGVADMVEPFGVDGEIAIEYPNPTEEIPGIDSLKTDSKRTEVVKFKVDWIDPG